MNTKILPILALTIVLQGCYPAVKESGEEVLEKCYDGVVYVSNKNTNNSSISVKFNRDSTVSTKLINGVDCK